MENTGQTTVPKLETQTGKYRESQAYRSRDPPAETAMGTSAGLGNPEL